MSRPRVVTPEAMDLFRAEAVRRAKGLSNKQLARVLEHKLSSKYIGQIVAALRREYERKHPCVEVSCGTESFRPSDPIT